MNNIPIHCAYEELVTTETGPTQHSINRLPISNRASSSTYCLITAAYAGVPSVGRTTDVVHNDGKPVSPVTPMTFSPPLVADPVG